MSRVVNQQPQQPSPAQIPTESANTYDDGRDDQDIVLSSDQVQDQDGDQPGSGGWILDGPDDIIEPETQTQQPPSTSGQPQPPSQQPVQQGGQPQAQFEHRLKTGHIFRGASPEEVMTQVEAHYSRINQDSQQYQGGSQYQQPQPQQQSPRRREPVQPSATDQNWNTEEFYKAFATNPLEAMDMYFRHRLGDPEDFLARLDTSYSTAVQVTDRIAIADFFTNNADFPASNESAAMVLRRLERDNVDVSAWNLEVAYRQMVREGALVPLQLEQQQPVQQQSVQQGNGQGQPQPQRRPQSRGTGAPPPPGGSGMGEGDLDLHQGGGGTGRGQRIGDVELTIQQFEDLSSADMRVYMQRRREIQSRQQRR